VQKSQEHKNPLRLKQLRKNFQGGWFARGKSVLNQIFAGMVTGWFSQIAWLTKSTKRFAKIGL